MSFQVLTSEHYPGLNFHSVFEGSNFISGQKYQCINPQSSSSLEIPNFTVIEQEGIFTGYIGDYTLNGTIRFMYFGKKCIFKGKSRNCFPINGFLEVENENKIILIVKGQISIIKYLGFQIKLLRTITFTEYEYSSLVVTNLNILLNIINYDAITADKLLYKKRGGRPAKMFVSPEICCITGDFKVGPDLFVLVENKKYIEKNGKSKAR